jgi:hypothetical protein
MYKLAWLNSPSVLFIDNVESLFLSRTDILGRDSVGTGIGFLYYNILDKIFSVIFLFWLVATTAFTAL